VYRVFLLSPARSGGKRAAMLLNKRATFDLARRLRLKSASLGEAFTFLSGLYFRGKIIYAKKFAHPPLGLPGAFVITSNRGLLDANTPLDLKVFKSFSKGEVDESNPDYCLPLIRDARALAAKLGPEDEVVLLGSIATGKYTNVLLNIFQRRLLFPAEFVGRGDFSRGGFMLRCAAAGTEQEYIAVQGAIRKGRRPPKLTLRPK
jgi:hypothetical protein